jgi:cytochrome c nitrite reductase small subunit
MRRTGWLLFAGVLLGFAVGLSAFTFTYAKGSSYLTNDPQACANCHVMSDHYGGWLKSSHRAVATCNDCHTPPGLVGKYTTKASNGFLHAYAFTTGTFPDQLRIREHNADVVEQACRKCHTALVNAVDGAAAAHTADGGEPLACVRCHASVGH